MALLVFLVLVDGLRDCLHNCVVTWTEKMESSSFVPHQIRRSVMLLLQALGE
jgi:hypothetical protein